jgi:ribosomal protein S18 acetylase RimI-like enzyme
MAGLRKFLRYLFSGQFAAIGAAVAERVPIWLYHHWKAYLFEANLPAPATPPDLPSGYHCRTAEAADLEALSRMIGLPVEEYRRRFDSGEVCFAIFEGDRPANLNWIHRGPCYVRGSDFTLQAGPDDYYIYGIFTDPAERGRGLYKKGLLHLTEYLRARGARRFTQMVETNNAPVLHTLPQLGYRKTITINHIRILGVKYTRIEETAVGQVERRWLGREPEGIFPI